MADPAELLRQLESPTYGRASAAENARVLLERLEALGDLRPAEAEQLRQLREGAGANQQAMGETDALYRGALQGATFNWADEIGGMVGGDTDAIRAKNAAAQAEHPREYNTGRGAGGMLTGGALALGTGGMSTGPTLLSTMGRGAIAGGLEGLLWGGGRGEGMEKVGTAAKDGFIGAGVGAAAPAVVAGAGTVLGAGRDLVTGGIDAVRNRANPKKANRAIVESMMKSGKSAAEIDDAVRLAAQQGQPEFRLMDALGQAGQRRASGIVRAGGPGSDELAEFLAQRQADQGDRVAGFVGDAFGFRGQGAGQTGPAVVGAKGGELPSQVLSGPQRSAAQTKAALKAARGGAADVAYAAARKNAGAVDVRGAVAVIDDRIGGMQGSNIAGDRIDAKLARYRGRLAADPVPNGEISRELSDFSRVLGVKQSVQDDIRAAIKAGRGNEASELRKLMDELDAALEASSDMYRAANDGFRSASRVIDAVDDGAAMATRGRATDNVSGFGAMGADQQKAARIGYGDKLLQKIEANAAPTSNKARPLTSTKAATEADAMALDPDLYRARIAREGDMWETQNRALGGSRTADNLQDIDGVSPLADAGRAVGAAASMNFGQAMSNAASAIAPYVKGQNEATRTLIARALMSKDPMAVLTPALKSKKTNDTVRRIVEGIIRGGERGAEVIPR